MILSLTKKFHHNRGCIFGTSTFVLIIALCVWQFRKFLGYDIPNVVHLETANKKLYDIIIVGAGTAGSVLANRLVFNFNGTVLLIEAGTAFGILSSVPLLSTMAQGTSFDWGFQSIPQKYSSSGLVDKKQFLPRGKGLGGSSQINYMLHSYGVEADYVQWKELAGDEWTLESLSKYMDLNVSARNNNEDGTQGYYTVKPTLELLTKTFLSSQAEAQLFSKDKLQFAAPIYTTRNGQRWGAFQRYLRPTFHRNNFDILRCTTVHKVLFKNKKASSVIVHSNPGCQGGSSEAKLTLIRARRQIIIAAGAFNSPQLLKMSGIGPSAELVAANISIVAASERVGANLIDHLNLPLFVSLSGAIASITLDKLTSFSEIYKYFVSGEGLYSSFGVFGIGQVIARDYAISFFGAGSVDESALKNLSNFKDDAFRSLFPLYYNSSQEGFVMLSTCQHPISRGTVKVVTGFNKLPLVDPNYLSHLYDIKCMINAIRLGVSVLRTSPFRALSPTIQWPYLSECRNFGPFPDDFKTNHPNDRYLECILRSVALTAHHPHGTCAMGADPTSVLDEHLNVRGVSGLRVVDGSSIPISISGTPNSVIIAFAEKAAEIIIQELKSTN